MTVIGCTGHQQMPDEACERAMAEIKRSLCMLGPSVIGVSALAAGADQMFAGVVHDLGGELHVIVPSKRYETTFTDQADLDEYRRLLALTTSVTILPFGEPTEEAFYAAGRAVVDACDALWAVWDGEPARGLGGSADVVRYARSSGKPVQIIWPAGLRR